MLNIFSAAEEESVVQSGLFCFVCLVWSIKIFQPIFELEKNGILKDQCCEKYCS